MSDMKDEQLAWIRAVLKHLGISATELARRARIAPSTLNKPLNDPNHPSMLSVPVLNKIADVAKLKVLEFPGRPRGFGESEVQPYKAGPGAENDVERAVSALCRPGNGRDPWIIQSYTLELQGLLPGDIVIVDLNLTPAPRDIVCAQIYDWDRTKAETVMRLYEAPYLITHSLRDGAQKPIVVDGQNVIIRGVITDVLRHRRAA